MHIFLVFSNIIHSHICKRFKIVGIFYWFSANFIFFPKEKVLGTQSLSAEANKGFFKKQGATSFMKIAS